MRGYTYFISHAGPDTALAQSLVKRLEDSGHKAIDYIRDFPKKSDFIVEITKALLKADYVIALVSQDYVDSSWCMKEYLIASDSGRLIPFVVGRCDLSHLPKLKRPEIHHLKADQQVQIIIDSLPEMQKGLSPARMNRDKIIEQVGQIRIVLPQFLQIFSDPEEAKWFIDSVVNVLQGYWIVGENVEIILDSGKKGVSPEALMRSHRADLLFYEQKESDGIALRMLFTRGWVMERLEKLPPDNPLFVFEEDASSHQKLLSDTIFWMITTVLANLYEARNLPKKAKELYNRIINGLVVRFHAPYLGGNESGMSNRLYLKARTKNMIQDWSGAMGDITYLLKQIPFGVWPDLYAERGEAYLGLGKFLFAVQDFDTAIDKGADDPRLFKMRGEAHWKLGNLAKSLTDYEHYSHKVGGKDAEVLKRISDIKRKLGM